MKICYLTWGETPRSYGVFGSQVLGQFLKTSTELKEARFYFISGVPIIHSGLIREKLGYFNEIKKIKKKLFNIPFLFLPIFCTQNFIESSKLSFKFFHGFSHFLLKRKLKNINPSVVHCRSYHAAWAAVQIKLKHNFKFKIVFDPRGLFPEEVALKKNYSEVNEDYKYLKKIEEEIISNIDVLIAVSDTMANYYKRLGVDKVKTIYLSSDVSLLKPSNLNSTKQELNFIYVGALSNSTWHKITELKYLMIHILNKVPESNFTIVTTSNHKEIIKEFNDFPIDKLHLTSTKNLNELKPLLQKANFGLMSYFTPKTQREIVLSDMVMAVKTAEYFAAGLPLILNKYCGGASHIVNENNIGIAYTPSEFKEITKSKIVSLTNSSKKNEISNLAEELFDYSSNANRYKQVYIDLYSSNH